MPTTSRPRQGSNPGSKIDATGLEASVSLTEPWTIPFDDAHVCVGDQQYRVHVHGGGLVGRHAVVAPSVFVGPNAMVKDRAIVVGSVRLFDRSVIEGTALVADSVTLRENASIGGEALVRGQASLAHHARIDGDARVNGGVLLQHYAHISRGVLSGGMTVN
ncbi:hypothetical protein SAMN05880568_3289 [Microbacterium sp. RURRCA19A]|nr:hypothetical protein SAMN05880568_3289 [Microbacterium sp. RURRCA19A]